MTFAGKSLEEIRQEMNRRYSAGAAYAETLPWDRARTEAIIANALTLAAWPALTVPMGSREPGMTLDVGCGQGGVAPWWKDRSELVGLELSEAAVAKATELYPGVDFRVGAIEEFETDERFDTIVAVETIEHWADVHKGLDNVRRLLKDDGVFVVTTPNRDSLHCRIGRRLGLSVPFCSDDHVHEFGYQELVGLLARHGLRVTRSLGAFLQPYWALEAEVGHRIRKLTDHDEELIELLAKAGVHAPEIAFVQCHACRPE